MDGENWSAEQLSYMESAADKWQLNPGLCDYKTWALGYSLHINKKVQN